MKCPTRTPPDLYPPVQRAHLTGDDPQQRRLAGSVRPDQPYSVARSDLERRTGEQHLVAIRRGEIDNFEHARTQSRARDHARATNRTVHGGYRHQRMATSMPPTRPAVDAITELSLRFPSAGHPPAATIAPMTTQRPPRTPAARRARRLPRIRRPLHRLVGADHLTERLALDVITAIETAPPTRVSPTCTGPDHAIRASAGVAAISRFRTRRTCRAGRCHPACPGSGSSGWSR